MVVVMVVVRGVVVEVVVVVVVAVVVAVGLPTKLLLPGERKGNYARFSVWGRHCYKYCLDEMLES